MEITTVKSFIVQALVIILPDLPERNDSQWKGRELLMPYLHLRSSGLAAVQSQDKNDSTKYLSMTLLIKTMLTTLRTSDITYNTIAYNITKWKINFLSKCFIYCYL